MTLAELYADLVDRAWHALAEVKARARTGDEDKGHEFHGNQWTGGLGAKPKTITAKTSKAGVHELLSSGHPFTKQELMEVCGIKTEKLLSDYLAMLKNPKYAGPKGALAIQSKDGHYFVAMPNGQPAPPLEQATQKLNTGAAPSPISEPEQAAPAAKAITPPMPAPAKKMTLGEYAKASSDPYGQKKLAEQPHDPSTQAAMANLINAKPEPIPEPPKADPEAAAVLANKESPYATGVNAMMNTQPGSMPSSEADKHYTQAMAAANVYLAHKVKTSDAPTGEAAVLTWKNQKAAAMAAWAQAVHGKTVAPKAQELFKADKQLATDLAQGKSITDAVNAWKTNTTLEKQGNFPPKATPSPAAKAAAAKPETIADMGHAAHVTPIDYDTIVPAAHTPIGPDDFATEAGVWSKSLSAVKASLISKSTGSDSDNKAMVEKALRERLKDKPNFQALVKRLGLAKTGYGSLESRLIGAWAGSSGDHQDISVALQMAVRDAFSIPDGHIEKAALGSLNAHGHDVDKLTASAIQQLNGNTKTLQPHEVQTARAALQEFVQAQYAETQDLLQKLGHDHVYLARGMGVHVSHANAQGPANVKLQPASSFSTSYSTANSFGKGKTVFLTKVPRQQILSTFLTGFGCTGENEVVVLAHNSLKAYTVPTGLQQTSAAARVHEEIKSGKPKPMPGSLAAHQEKILADMKKAEALKQKMAMPNPQVQKASQAFIASALTQNPADHHAALKKAVINAKSKALKAKQAAAKYEAQLKPGASSPLVEAKKSHAAKSAEEAKAAVEALQAFLKGSK